MTPILSDLSVLMLALAAIAVAHILSHRTTTHMEFYCDLTPPDYDDPDDDDDGVEVINLDEGDELDLEALADAAQDKNREAA